MNLVGNKSDPHQPGYDPPEVFEAGNATELIQGAGSVESEGRTAYWYVLDAEGD